MPEPTLYTFPPSLDSEFSRFLLHHYGVSVRERRHVIPFQSVVTLVRAGTPKIPTLVGFDDHPLDTVAKILAALEARAPADRKLLAHADEQQWSTDWPLFHTVMQSATTAFPYYHLLPHRDLMVRALSEGAPAWERAAVATGYPAFAALLRVLLQLTPAKAILSRDTIRSTLAAIDDRLRDGRPYLYGDRLTIADISFAIAAAPVVWPDNYGGPLPPLGATPAPLQDLVAESRERPSGAFALRMYREHRGG
jgi:glutathione S-transferase